MERKPKNEAGIDVWYEYMESMYNVELSDKIILLSGSHSLEEEDLKKYNELIDEQKLILEETKFVVENNNKISTKIYEFMNELNDDEKLQTLFSDLSLSKYISREFKTPEDVENTYIELRTKYVDVEGYEELNGIYNDIMNHINMIESPIKENSSGVKCEVPNCVFCTPPTTEEKQNAYDSLLGDGYFSKDSKDALIELMVIILRLQRMNSSFLDDIDDIDEE